MTATQTFYAWLHKKGYRRTKDLFLAEQVNQAEEEANLRAKDVFDPKTGEYLGRK